MGNCLSRRQQDVLTSKVYLDLEYLSRAELKVKERDYNNKVVGHDRVSFSLTSPCMSVGRGIHIGGKSLHITGTILPGQDPRKMIDKECQDNLFFVEVEGALLATLFDGHGREGLRVVDFCAHFMQDFFHKHHQKFRENPGVWIQNIIEECDKELRKDNSLIDCSISGSTAVCVYMNEAGVHVGSVGDSRAILGTIPDNPDEVPKFKPPEPDEVFKRNILPTRLLNAIPLTVDQKPNHQEELERIRKSGGRVQRLTDERGNKIGPYRVWKRNSNLPGLAMSRSIGDGIATEIGVIATPIFNSFDLDLERDQFIVIASDGVWDVFDNVEVVNFVERFRKSCLRIPAPTGFPVRVSYNQPTNATMSHILCEEARFRWFGIVEDEDVMIDDISVLIIELSSIEPSISRSSAKVTKRRTERMKSVSTIEETESNEVNPDSRSDARRGSFLPSKTSAEATNRRDPARGSIAIASETGQSPAHPDETRVDDN